jgi:hypothetical protein
MSSVASRERSFTHSQPLYPRSRQGTLDGTGHREAKDWHTESARQVLDADHTIRIGNTDRIHSHNAIGFGEKVTGVNDNRVERALKSKMGQTTKLKNMLEETVAKTNLEISKMEAIRKHLEAEKHKFSTLYARNQERRQQRAHRPGRELVRDMPLKELKRETDVLAKAIEKCDEKLHEVLHSTERLRKLKQLLKNDLVDKHSALEIDRKCLDMVATDNTAAMGTLPESVTSGLPFGWKKDTHVTCDATREAQRQAMKVRKGAFHVANRVKNASKDQYDAVQAALNHRMKSVQVVKDSLIDQVSLVEEEIIKLIKVKKELESSIKDKMPPLNLARQRYITRTKRPKRESVFDEVEHALLMQYNELKEVVVELQKRLQTVVGRLTTLKIQKSQFEVNIQDKSNCLNMDNVCAAMAPSRPQTSVSLRSSNLSLHSVQSRYSSMAGLR